MGREDSISCWLLGDVARRWSTIFSVSKSRVLRSGLRVGVRLLALAKGDNRRGTERVWYLDLVLGLRWLE